MNIPFLSWESVKVTCPSDKSKNREYRKSYVQLGEDQGLRIVEASAGEDQRSALYARARLLSLTMTEARFEAFWWGSSLSDKGQWVDHSFVRVEIVCQF